MGSGPRGVTDSLSLRTIPGWSTLMLTLLTKWWRDGNGEGTRTSKDIYDALWSPSKKNDFTIPIAARPRPPQSKHKVNVTFGYSQYQETQCHKNTTSPKKHKHFEFLKIRAYVRSTYETTEGLLTIQIAENNTFGTFWLGGHANNTCK